VDTIPCKPPWEQQMDPRRVAQSLFARITDGLEDGDLPHQIQVSTELRHLIEDREIGLRGQNSTRVFADSEPPRRASAEAVES
jgi:hypothetical protein